MLIGGDPTGTQWIADTGRDQGPCPWMPPDRIRCLEQHTVFTHWGFPSLCSNRRRNAQAQLPLVKHHQLTGGAMQHNLQTLTTLQRFRDEGKGLRLREPGSSRWNRIRLSRCHCARQDSTQQQRQHKHCFDHAACVDLIWR